MNMAELLFRHAVDFPDRTALIHRRRSLTYGELALNVRRRMARYRAGNIRSGDRVLIFVPMSIELYEILLALFGLGAVAVFLDAWADGRRMDHALNLAECRAFIGVPKSYFLFLKSRALRRVPVKLTPWAISGAPDPSLMEPDAEAALITFTTGSTGIPKAALRTHAFLLAQHRALSRELALPPDAVDMATLPIFALGNLASGITTVIAPLDPRRPGNADGGMVLAEMRRHNVTSTAGSPAFFERLIEAAETVPPPVSLKKLFVGGAAVDPGFAARLQIAFPGCECIAVYGSTEAEPIASLSCGRLAGMDIARGIPAGTPCGGIEIAVLPIGGAWDVEYPPDKWLETQLPPGVPGEICVAGEHVLRHYFRCPEAEREVKIAVGEKVFHRTGDAGMVDGDGQLFLLGRAKRVFAMADGTMCFPALVEAALKAVEGVRAGTMLNISGRGTLLVVESDLPAERLRPHLERLPWRFDELAVMGHIPRDPRHNSKIDCEKLAHSLQAMEF